MKLMVVRFIAAYSVGALSAEEPKPEATEVWSPVPRVVTPGKVSSDPPSDAIILSTEKT